MVSKKPKAQNQKSQKPNWKKKHNSNNYSPLSCSKGNDKFVQTKTLTGFWLHIAQTWNKAIEVLAGDATPELATSAWFGATSNILLMETDRTLNGYFNHAVWLRWAQETADPGEAAGVALTASGTALQEYLGG